MDGNLKVPETPTTPDSAIDRTNRLMVRAIMLSEGAQEELSRARTARLEAERIREEAEAQVAKATDEAFAYARTQAQKLVEEAAEAKSKLEAESFRARMELEQVEAAKIEAEKIHQKLEAEARERAEQIIQEALHRAEDQVFEMKRRAAEEVHRILEDISTLHAAAQEEVEARRLLAHAARVRAQAPRLEALATLEPEGRVRSNSHNTVEGSEPAVAEPITSLPRQEPEATEPANSAPQPEHAVSATTSRKSSKKSGAGGSET